MEGRALTFRVFASSIPPLRDDLVAERNALQEHAFPRLHEHCQKHQARFQAIDLRFRLRRGYGGPRGITKEQADNDRNLDICLWQIDECRPFFIDLPSERFGRLRCEQNLLRRFRGLAGLH